MPQGGCTIATLRNSSVRSHSTLYQRRQQRKEASIVRVSWRWETPRWTAKKWTLRSAKTPRRLRVRPARACGDGARMRAALAVASRCELYNSHLHAVHRAPPTRRKQTATTRRPWRSLASATISSAARPPTRSLDAYTCALTSNRGSVAGQLVERPLACHREVLHRVCSTEERDGAVRMSNVQRY